MKRPPLGWRTHAKLIREFRQGGIADRWSERRLLILLAEYRLNCRRELVVEVTSADRRNGDLMSLASIDLLEQVCDHPE